MLGVNDETRQAIEAGAILQCGCLPGANELHCNMCGWEWTPVPLIMPSPLLRSHEIQALADAKATDFERREGRLPELIEGDSGRMLISSGRAIRVLGFRGRVDVEERRALCKRFAQEAWDRKDFMLYLVKNIQAEGNDATQIEPIDRDEILRSPGR